MILILDDHPLVQQGVKSIIQMHGQEEEIVCASSLKESMKLMESQDVTMAFVDLYLGKESGLDLLAWVKEQRMMTKMFVITSSSKKSDFDQARRLDVDAYVLKDAFLEEIVYGLKTVERGKKFYSSALMVQQDGEMERDHRFSALTQREKDVLLLLAEGYSNSQISESLYISEGTTKKHISSILSKLEVQNRVEAALIASQNLDKLKQAQKSS